MLVWIIVGIVLLVIVMSNFLGKSKENDSNKAYEKTLMPMAEWWDIVGDSSISQREKLSYSLILQAATIVESRDLVAPGSLKTIMDSNPEISSSNFVLFLLETVSDCHLGEFNFLKNSFKTDQARVHLAINIELLLKHGGPTALSRIALAACSNPVS